MPPNLDRTTANAATMQVSLALARLATTSLSSSENNPAAMQGQQGRYTDRKSVRTDLLFEFLLQLSALVLHLGLGLQQGLHLPLQHLLLAGQLVHLQY